MSSKDLWLCSDFIKAERTLITIPHIGVDYGGRLSGSWKSVTTSMRAAIGDPTHM